MQLWQQFLDKLVRTTIDVCRQGNYSWVVQGRLLWCRTTVLAWDPNIRQLFGLAVETVYTCARLSDD